MTTTSQEISQSHGQADLRSPSFTLPDDQQFNTIQQTVLDQESKRSQMEEYRVSKRHLNRSCVVDNDYDIAIEAPRQRRPLRSRNKEKYPEGTRTSPLRFDTH